MVLPIKTCSFALLHPVRKDLYLTLYGPNSFFSSFFVFLRRFSFRLQAHRRDAYTKFFDDPFFK